MSASAISNAVRGRPRWPACVSVMVLTSAALVALARPAEAASTYYVDDISGCSNSGASAGSQARPFCTIGAAAKLAVAGDSVVVADGIYEETVTPRNSGTATQRITYTAAPGARPLVTGGTRGFYLSGISYVTISGFRVADTSSSGIYSSRGTGISLENNIVTTSGLRVEGYTAYGIYLNGTSSSLIKGNVADDNSGSGIYLSSGSSNNVVTRNVSTNNARGWSRSAVGIDLRGPGNAVTSNVVHDNEDTGIQAYPGGNNSLISGNLAYDSMGFTTQQIDNCSPPTTGVTTGCILGDHGIDNYGVTGNKIIGNTVYGNATAGINVEGVPEGTPSGMVIKNNISGDNAVDCPNGAGGVGKCPRTKGNYRVDATSYIGTQLDHNMYYMTDTGGYPGNYQVIWRTSWYPTRDFAKFRSEAGQEAHGMAADPQWADLAARDFHLTASSPAIDGGDGETAGVQESDIDGQGRVDDPNAGSETSTTVVDIGAFEYAPPSAQTPTLAPTGTGTGAP